jgi:hypothetical protein
LQHGDEAVRFILLMERLRRCMPLTLTILQHGDEAFRFILLELQSHADGVERSPYFVRDKSNKLPPGHIQAIFVIELFPHKEIVQKKDASRQDDDTHGNHCGSDRILGSVHVKEVMRGI